MRYRERVCTSFVELDHTAQECGWYGWSEGAAPDAYMTYRCSCGDHWTFFTNNDAIQADLDDPEFFARRCAFMRTCVE